MNKCLIFIVLIFISCIELEFEAPYEDLNGIYLEWIKSYNYRGRKLLCEGQKGYMLNLQEDGLICYSFANVDSIFELNSYMPSYWIADFEIHNDYAYITMPDFGLEIVNFQETAPYLSGNLWITGATFIGLHNNYTYVAGNNNLTIVDVHDKNNPEKVTEYMFDDFIRWLEVDSLFAYILLSSNDFYVLDVSDPTNPDLISQISLLDTLVPATAFTVNKNFVHVLKDYRIEIYQMTETNDIEYISELTFPNTIRFIYADGDYGLACSGDLSVYLLNLEYPSRPCVSEIFDLGHYQNYGIIRDNYIYILTPYLKILEIKEIP